MRPSSGGLGDSDPGTGTGSAVSRLRSGTRPGECTYTVETTTRHCAFVVRANALTVSERRKREKPNQTTTPNYRHRAAPHMLSIRHVPRYVSRRPRGRASYFYPSKRRRARALETVDGSRGSGTLLRGYVQHTRSEPAHAEAWQPTGTRAARRFCVRDRVAAIVGVVGLDSCVHLHRSCELGYWLRLDATGRGLMTEAAQASAEFALRRMGVHRIRCAAATDNYPSLRVISRLGFRFEGIARQAEFVGSRWLDHAVFARLSTDEYRSADMTERRRRFPFLVLAPAVVTVLGLFAALIIAGIGVWRLSAQSDEAVALRCEVLAKGLAERLRATSTQERGNLIERAARASGAELLLVRQNAEVLVDETLALPTREQRVELL